MSKYNEPIRILSIDPGYDRIGMAILEKRKTDSGKVKEFLIFSQCFQTNKKAHLNERIFSLGEEVDRIVKLFKPTALSIENVYFQNNQKTVIGVSEAKGVCKYVAMANGLTVAEYTPLQIKVAITGVGNASKDQVAWMIPKLVTLDIDTMTKRSGGASKGLDDEIDAIAVGLTYFAHM